MPSLCTHTASPAPTWQTRTISVKATASSMPRCLQYEPYTPHDTLPVERSSFTTS